ncbi:hypothetical protein AJ80_04243 [Polytolypa hystricis UAMH7299]|uniref:Uncharacterized protein n=1 Tax=Polytolypa hystricis (strain UAMH7299) TaxID=1447883 RepID=A0A2B7YDP6_POLH7|nr:hypothetical protein AJ80_04243 [Polytolypa hystricis UAMH7299]
MSTTPRQTDLTKKPSQRLPPPSLFQGPPSRNTSNLSLASGALLAPTTKVISAASVPIPSPNEPPLLRQHSAKSNVSAPHTPLSPFLSRTRGQSDVDNNAADTLWEEMRNTLAEVELSAINGDHVFGTDHSKALEELRTKQLALAQAWVRSEADEVVDRTPPDDAAAAAAGGGGKAGGAGESLRQGSVGTEDGAGKFLDDKTEKDILLARKRREANDRYFDRVNSGVMDVVAKLEEVALAMKEVERESKEIWSEGESVDTAQGSENS